MKFFKKLKKYWNIQKPIRLKTQPNWNGEIIIPKHNDRLVKVPKSERRIIEYKNNNPEKTQCITRAFGDLLKDEEMI